MDTPWAALAAGITRLSDRIDALPSIREATVSSMSPLAVRFDTDTIDTLVQGSIASSVALGDRVLTLKLRHYIWILGGKGGVPIGSVIQSNVPQGLGYLPCDGREVSRAEYPKLFSTIGTTYGSGDGVNTFTIPNLNGKIIRYTVSQAAAVLKFDGLFTPVSTYSQATPHEYDIRIFIEALASCNIDMQFLADGAALAVANSYKFLRWTVNSGGAALAAYNTVTDRVYLGHEQGRNFMLKGEIQSPGAAAWTDYSFENKTRSGTAQERANSQVKGEMQNYARATGLQLLFNNGSSAWGWLECVPYGGSITPSYIKAS